MSIRWLTLCWQQVEGFDKKMAVDFLSLNFFVRSPIGQKIKGQKIVPLNHQG